MSRYVNPVLAKLAPKISSRDEIRKALDEHYDALVMFLEGVANDKWHLIVNGPTGSGKTEFTSSVLKRMDNISVQNLSGTLSAVKLFSHLHDYRKKGQVTVIDDTDRILEDTECLEVLKAALDSQSKKSVDWSKYSVALGKANTPDSFIYEGRCIIITNKVIQTQSTTTPTKQQQQLLPLISRCNYFRAGLPSRDWEIEVLKMFMDDDRIRVFKEGNVSKEVRKEIIDFVEDNADDLREVSFRTVAQLLELYTANKSHWKNMALASFGY